MKKIILSLILICVSLCVFAFDITKDGVASATIIMPKNPTKAEQFACDEFVKYIKAISGVELSVANVAGDGNNIFIGKSPESMKISGVTNWKKIKDDELIIYCKGKNLVLTGGKGSGVIYSVYDFLDTYLGVKYITYNEDFIPKNESISVDNISYKFISPFVSRETFFKQFMVEPMYALKMKMNGHHNNIPAEYGGHIQLYGWAHSFDRLISNKVYGESHPEWFSEVKGVRHNDRYSQLCLSNSELIKELTKNVLKTIKENPEQKIFSVTQNDNQDYCQCEKCQGLYEKYNHSGLLLIALNQVAKEVKKQYPNVLIETFAYNYTRTAPTGNIVPADNILIRLCSIEADFSKTFDDSANEDFYTNIKKWSKISKQLFVWDYVVNFSNYVILHPNFHVLQKNLQIMRDNKTIGVFEQGDSFNSNACLQNYKRYIIAKLVWNPNIDIAKETKEFMDAYYGPASSDMLAMVNYLNEVMPTITTKMGTYMQANSYLSGDDWVTCFKYLQSALKKCENTKYYDRVKFDLLCFNAGFITEKKDKVEYVNNNVDLIYKDRRKLLGELSDFLPKNGIKNFAEQKNFEDGPYYIKDNNKKEGIKPTICENLKDEDWLDYQEKDLPNVVNNEVVSKIVDDSKASNGKAIWISPKSSDWSIQKVIAPLFFDVSIKSADVYMTYRIEKNIDDGPSLEVGLYDLSARKNAFKYVASSGSAPEYQTVKVGEIDFTKVNPEGYIYIAGVINPKATKNIYVDRLFVILHRY